MIEKQQKLIDPDPFTIANTFMQAAALVLQLVQMKNAQQIGMPHLSAPSAQGLGQLENQSAQCIQKGNQLLRIVERGSPDADNQFYDQAFRLGQSLVLDTPSHMLFQSELGVFMTTVANTGQWVNHVIAMDPALAGRLGARLDDSLGDMVQRLNEIMEKGLPNREAIQAAKQTLGALAKAIESELDGKN